MPAQEMNVTAKLVPCHVYRVPGAPRVALLSDFHNRANPGIFEALRARKPFLICVAGDFMYGQEPLSRQEHVLPFLRECAEIAPTFLSLGNHEQWLTPREMKEIGRTGAVVLDNAWREITEIKRSGTVAPDNAWREMKEINGTGTVLPDCAWRETDGLVIGGLTSAYVTDRRRGKDGRAPETKWLQRFAAAPGYHILLCHHPEYYDRIPAGIELILCGHAHGGQIRIFNHGVFAPGQGFWPKYTKGVYEGRMVVSAGLSNTAWAPRVFNPVEAVFVEGTQEF